MSDEKLSQRLPPEVKALIQQASEEQRQVIIKYLIERIEIRPTYHIANLWDLPEFATSYWVFLMTGIDQTTQTSMAKELLFWKAISARDYARVLCVQSSDRGAFRYLAAQFDAHKFPAMILGNSPEMRNYVRLDPELLNELSAEEGRFQTFLTQVHNAIENGHHIEQIGKDLGTEQFWKTLKLVYREVKSFFSIKVTASVR